MGGSSAQLSIVLKLIDEATSALQGVSEQTRASLEEIKGKANEVRDTFGLMGAAIIGGLGVLATSAANEDTAQSQLNTAVKAGIAAASESTDATSTLAKEKANLQEQLAGVNAKLAEYESKLRSHSTTGATYAATIATLQTKQAGLKEQLDQVNNSLSLVGASTEAIDAQFEKAALANTALGFSIEDSLTAYTQLFRATDSVSQSMQAAQVAMDLSRATGLDLASAAKQVELAMEGNGRALKQFGINLKDGLSPGEALADLQLKLAGTAKDYVNTPWGQLDVAKAKTEALAATLGNSLVPVLEQFLQAVTPLIQKVADWAQEHPRLTSFILLAAGAVGLLSLAIAAVATIISTSITVFMGFSTLIEGIGLAVGAVSAPFLLWALAIGAVIAIVVLLGLTIAKHWTQVQQAFREGCAYISKLWTDTWNGISNFFTSMWNGLKIAIQDAINFISGLLDALLSKVSGITSKILSPIQSVAGTIGGALNAVGGVIGGAVKAFASGGIVTGPTLALVGEAGPEAIIPLSAFAGGPSLAGAARGGGAASVIVNINGGYYLDSGAATMIANAIGKQVVRQLKVSNFN